MAQLNKPCKMLLVALALLANGKLRVTNTLSITVKLEAAHADAVLRSPRARLLPGQMNRKTLDLSLRHAIFKVCAQDL